MLIEPNEIIWKTQLYIMLFWRKLFEASICVISLYVWSVVLVILQEQTNFEATDAFNFATPLESPTKTAGMCHPSNDKPFQNSQCTSWIVNNSFAL